MAKKKNDVAKKLHMLCLVVIGLVVFNIFMWVQVSNNQSDINSSLETTFDNSTRIRNLESCVIDEAPSCVQDPEPGQL
jgi:hypothetical protein